jgi:exosortase D (VPLPA-CTERM-specific)
MISEGKSLNHFLFKMGALLVLFTTAFWIPIRGIVNTWITNPDYSYGFLIPIISLYLIWERRDALDGVRIRNSWFVLPVLIVFILLSLYAILGSSGNISRPAVPLLVLLFTVFCFGVDLTRRFLLPLGFLIFMVPIPDFLERTIGLFLKTVSSRLGTALIRAFDIPVYLSGNVLDLGTSQLQVVDACSGLRYLFPLFALGVIYAHFFQRPNWKKWICVIATLPISVLMNSVRIGATGILTNKFGSEVAEGFFHGFSGWVMFLVAFLLLFGFGKILALFPDGHIGRESNAIERLGFATNSEREPKSVNPAFFLSIVLLLVIAGLTLSTKAMPEIKLDGGISAFPSGINDWKGKRMPVDPEMIRKSGAQEAFNGVYVNGYNENIDLYLGYRGSAFLENENFFHSPTVCLPASGWKMIGSKTHVIREVPFFNELTISELVMDSLGKKYLVYYWFQTKNRTSHNKDINRFHLSLHAIKRDNTHALFIRQITPINEDESITTAEERMDRFARDMMSTLLSFLKDRQTQPR